MSDLEAIVKENKKEIANLVENVNKSFTEIQVMLATITNLLESKKSAGSKSKASSSGTPKPSSATGGKRPPNIRDYFKKTFVENKDFRTKSRKLFTEEGDKDVHKKALTENLKGNESKEAERKKEAEIIWKIIQNGVKAKNKNYKKFESDLREQKKEEENKAEMKGKTENVIEDHTDEEV